MNPIPVLGIPHYNRPDLTARCIASIDYPVGKLVLVVNSENSISELGLIQRELAARMDAGLVKSTHIITHPNAGVAGAWNEIIKLFPAPWWLISNNDIEFAPGDLQKLGDCVTATIGKLDQPGKIYGNHGASWFAITAHGVATVGLFDENIFPAYLEDCDWSYRADLLGVRRFTIEDVHARHGDDKFTGSATIMSDAGLRKKNHRTHGGNFDYYRLKWGGINEQETFKTPFNQLDWPV